MENSVSAQKAELRKAFRLKRAVSDSQKKNRIDDAAIRGVISLPEFQSCGILLTYVSTGDEVNTKDMIALALKSGKRVAVPRTISAEKKMEFYEIHSLDELKPDKHGILEPDADPAGKVENSANSICLVPGLVFDRSGSRIGYGGGYYDRYLENYAGITVGVCRSAQLYEASLPQESHDVRLNMIVTEDEIIRPVGDA